MRRALVCRVGLLLAIPGLTMSPASAGETMTYTYDELGRLLVVQSAGTVNNNQAMTYCYDAVGNRMRVKSSDSGSVASCPAGSTAPPQKANPEISITDALDFRGEALTFSIALDAPGTSVVSVDYATAAGTAGADDFEATSGTLTFGMGQTVRTISVQTSEAGDGGEFTVNLTNPTGGASIADNQGLGWIVVLNEPTCFEGPPGVWNCSQ